MKVKEIRGYWEDLSFRNMRDLHYYAFYYAKIEDKYVIIERRLQNDFKHRGPILKYKLSDSITGIYACDDEKDFEERIQAIIQYKEKDGVSRYFKNQQFFPPLEMQNGREIDLKLANIEVRRCSANDQASYEYVKGKKREELLLDRLDQLQQTIRNSPERYSIERYIEKYEQQSGTQLRKQQISRLKELDDIIQKGLISGRYNLEDYSNFLNSIPDLLSGKKVLGFGHFDSDGFFSSHGEINSTMPSAEKMALYNTYTYRTFRARDNKYQYTMDDFQVMPLPSIERRMDQDGLCVTDKLCVMGMEEVSFGSNEIYDYNNGILIVEPHDIRKAHLFAHIPALSASDISTALQEISRKCLVTDVQAQLIGLADEKTNERREEQL